VFAHRGLLRFRGAILIQRRGRRAFRIGFQPRPGVSGSGKPRTGGGGYRTMDRPLCRLCGAEIAIFDTVTPAARPDAPCGDSSAGLDSTLERIVERKSFQNRNSLVRRRARSTIFEWPCRAVVRRGFRAAGRLVAGGWGGVGSGCWRVGRKEGCGRTKEQGN